MEHIEIEAERERERVQCFKGLEKFRANDFGEVRLGLNIYIKF